MTTLQEKITAKRLAAEPSTGSIDDTLRVMLSIAWITYSAQDVYSALKSLHPAEDFSKSCFENTTDLDPAKRLTNLVAKLPDREPYVLLHAAVRAFVAKTSTQETSMASTEDSKPSLTSRIKMNGTAVAKDAGWRILAAQIVRTASQSVTAGVRAKLKNSRAVQRQINRVLESPYGEAGIGMILSIGTLAFMPASSKRDRLSHEFAVGAATLIGNDTINTFLDPFRTFITDVVPAMMASLPEPEPTIGVSEAKVAEKVRSE